MPTKLYVGNLAYSVTNDDLEGLFSQASRNPSRLAMLSQSVRRSFLWSDSIQFGLTYRMARIQTMEISD